MSDETRLYQTHDNFRMILNLGEEEGLEFQYADDNSKEWRIRSGEKLPLGEEWRSTAKMTHFLFIILGFLVWMDNEKELRP